MFAGNPRKARVLKVTERDRRGAMRPLRGGVPYAPALSRARPLWALGFA